MASTHRVRRVVFDLSCEDHESAFQARRRFDAVLRDRIADVLDEVFSAYSPNGSPHTMGRIEIDLGRLNIEQLDDIQLRDLVLRKLKRRFLEMRTDDVSIERAGHAPAAIFIHFLETGQIRWDAAADSLTDVQRMVLDLSESEIASLAEELRTVLKRQAARFRLSHQFGVAFFEWIVRLLSEDALESITESIERAGGSLELPEWRLAVVSALISVSSNPGENLDLSMEVAAARARERDQHEADLAESRETVVKETDGATYYTRQAGLVLLHPFLRAFFEELHIVDEHAAFTSPEARTKAVHLLHFLAVGTIGPEEHTLTLEKLLAGYPLESPLPLDVDLYDWEVEECEALLDSVIGHWGKLRKTSPDGLRDGFLKREGRLVRAHSSWELTVESRGLDVLLDALPWGLSYMRLPWMPDGLQIHWV